MKFWSLLIVAWMPILEVLLIGLVAALLATSYINILPPESRKHINKIVFVLFVPDISFTCLAESVTLKDLISWWFMPVNLTITFFFGAALGWIAAMILKPGSHLHGLVIACCSGGNWGTLPLIIVPALCNEPQSPFQKSSDCDSKGLSYVSLSMALGNILIWTHCYYVMKRSAKIHKRLCRENSGSSKTSEVSHHSYVREEDKEDYETLLPPSTKVDFDEWNCKNVNNFLQFNFNIGKFSFTISAVHRTLCRCLPTLKSLIAGENAPLHVIQDSLKLLGDAAIPCTILILGGNLSKGIRKSAMKPLLVVAITAIRYVILPICGIGVVAGADKLGFLPESPLFKYVLLIQFTVPPAMSLGTIAQLFEVGEEECSVIFFWTYLIAAIALTVWSMVFMSILF
ncbi:protein PIN-LIKES 7-like [Carex rostrata]